MELKVIENEFSICQINDLSNVNLSDEYYFISKTIDELSLVCLTSSVPNNTIKCENGWKAFKIVGVLDFMLVGIIATISTILADNDISIFTISTYNTDYILIKEHNFDQAIDILKKDGFIVE